MQEIKEYVHTVQYYETDKMGITHHSNYIRWMEEARVDLLGQIGWDYAKLEKLGIFSPVVGITCEYRHPTTFADRIAIRASVSEFRNVSMAFAYEMRKEDGTVVFTAVSQHAFLTADGRPARIRRDHPDVFETFSRLAAPETE